MTIAPNASFEEFVDRVSGKFGLSPSGLMIKFMDEDGNKVSLMDDSDYDLALEVAKDSAKGKPEGKLEVWCNTR